MSKPEIVIIAAIAEKNRAIGYQGKLPWYISEDLRRFKQLTVGHAVLMGRKTFESIVERLGKPLPDRRNVVLTKYYTFPQWPHVETCASWEEAMNLLKEEERIFVIGGQQVFARALPVAHRLELTIVEGDYPGDAFFPDFENLGDRNFHLLERMEKKGFRFETYVRVSQRKFMG